ncbi:hypothetical protein LXL04_027548 [Taraxacum kok-saghyz]
MQKKKKKFAHMQSFWKKKSRFFGNFFFATGLIFERFLAPRSRFFEKVNGLGVLGARLIARESGEPGGIGGGLGTTFSSGTYAHTALPSSSKIMLCKMQHAYIILATLSLSVDRAPLWSMAQRRQKHISEAQKIPDYPWHLTVAA